MRRMIVCALRYMPIALLMIAASASPSIQADKIVSVDPSIQYQTFQGWGTSLAWWAKVVGGFPEPVRSDYMEKAFDPVKGLGLNIVRYNIGGGENPTYQAPNQQFLQYRAAVPGFEPEPGKWDWNADADQRWVLREAIRRGANQLEAFSNSPPYWMTISGSVTGNRYGANNLKTDSFDAFAGYLAAVVKHFHDDWGVTFRTLEPLNEPSGGWSFGHWQEGCHFDRQSQNTLVKATGAALAREGLRTTVTASDEPSIGDADRTFDYYDGTALAALSKINTHSYGGGDRTQLSSFARSAGKDLWLSEYGDNDASGIAMSRRILEDMNGLHPTAWIYWQVVDPVGGWGFLNNPLKDETTTAYVINKKYYVMGNYSKFIRPGFKFIAIGDPNSLAAYDPRSRTLVIVTTNSDSADARITYDLSGFTRIGPTVTAYRTSPTEDLAKLPAITMDNKHFVSMNPARSVTTYVIAGTAYTGPKGIDYRSYYRLVNRESGLVADVDSGSKQMGSGIVQDKSSGARSQQWGLVATGDGYYRIVNRNSGLVLDVNHASTDAGGDLIQYSDNGGDNQQWRLERVGSDTFKIVNRRSGLLLGASLNAAASGLVQQTDDGSVSRQWRLLKVGSE